MWYKDHLLHIIIWLQLSFFYVILLLESWWIGFLLSEFEKRLLWCCCSWDLVVGLIQEGTDAWKRKYLCLFPGKLRKSKPVVAWKKPTSSDISVSYSDNPILKSHFTIYQPSYFRMCTSSLKVAVFYIVLWVITTCVTGKPCRLWHCKVP